MLDQNVVAPMQSEFSVEHMLAPVTVRQFLDLYWGKRHLVVRRNDPAHYGSIFRLADVDRYLAIAARNPDAWFSLGKGEGIARRARIQEVEVHELYAAINSGVSVLLESVDRCWLPVAKLASGLAEELSARVKVNVYVTPAGCQGAPLHPDVQDVFVLQMEGAKEWYIYDDRVYEAVETLKHFSDMAYSRPRLAENPALAERTVLEQGDLLYLPRGVLHRAVAPPTTPSVHLTVCVTPVYWVDFLKAAVEILSIERPEFGRPLTPGFEREPAVQDGLRGEFESLLSLFRDTASFEQTIALFARMKARTRSNPADGHFEQLMSVDALEADAVVERRRGLTPSVKVQGESAILSFSTGQIKAAVTLLPALEFVRDHKRFRAQDLPDVLSTKSKLVLIKRLIQEGLLRVAVA